MLGSNSFHEVLDGFNLMLSQDKDIQNVIKNLNDKRISAKDKCMAFKKKQKIRKAKLHIKDAISFVLSEGVSEKDIKRILQKVIIYNLLI